MTDTTSPGLKLTREQLDALEQAHEKLERRIEKHYPNWRWVAGITVGVLLGGAAMAQSVAKEAKADLKEERSERGAQVKEIKEDFKAVKHEVQASARETADKLNRIQEALERLEKRARR